MFIAVSLTEQHFHEPLNIDDKLKFVVDYEGVVTEENKNIYLWMGEIKDSSGWNETYV